VNVVEINLLRGTVVWHTSEETILTIYKERVRALSLTETDCTACRDVNSGASGVGCAAVLGRGICHLAAYGGPESGRRSWREQGRRLEVGPSFSSM
jgi:hypothetical protein